jgi:alpha-galactosidase/6-phospho-beta-glucosidase family protein
VVRLGSSASSVGPGIGHPGRAQEAQAQLVAEAAYGVRPIHTGPLPEALAAHLRHYVSFQQHVVKAALSGDRKAALHAFLLDATTQSHLDLDQTQALLDELLEANKQYLPLFER